MKKRLVIFGAGGFGREVLQLVRDINEVTPAWDCEGFLVDSKYLGGAGVQGLPLLGDIGWLEQNPDVQLVVAVGAPAARRKIVQKIQLVFNNTFATLVHPRAWVGRNVIVGEGSILCAGSLITTDIKIGRHVHVNIGSTIGHDAILDDFVTLNPSVNVSGNAKLKEGAEVGTSSVILPGISVGHWSIVGAGSVVTKEVPSNVTAVGAPAKPIKERVQGWQDA